MNGVIQMKSGKSAELVALYKAIERSKNLDFQNLW